MKRNILIGVGAVAFALLIWPTPYRYDKISYSNGGGAYREAGQVIVRINRITGNAQQLSPSGWVDRK